MERYREVSQRVPDRGRRSEPVASTGKFLQKVPWSRQGSIIGSVACCFVACFCLIALGCGGSDPGEILADGSYNLHVTAKDSRGHWNAKIGFDDQPASIQSGQSYTKSVTVELPEACWLYKIDAFNGLDRGDIVEMDTAVFDSVGRVLYQRGEHKESPEVMYNAQWPIETDAITTQVNIYMHAHVTDPDEPARVHWNVMLWCAPAKPDVPPPPPPPLVKPEDYITVVRAGELGEKCVTSTGLLRELCFDEQELIWDGIRHPEYALGHCCSRLPGPWPITVIVENGVCASPEVKINRVVFSELHEFMTKLQQVNKRCKPSHPEHAPEFCDHTNVNKLTFKVWRSNRLEPSMDLAGRLRGIDNWCRGQ